MPEENRILESLGKLSGLVEASREDIKTLVGKHDEQSKYIQSLATSVQVIQTSYEGRASTCAKEFKDINAKLGRDYDSINELKNKNVKEEGVEEYKGQKRNYLGWVLGIIGAIVGILIGINQLLGINQQLTVTPLTGSPSAYASSIVPNKDTTKHFVLNIDTIKGK